jgi:hypothetical protein
MLSPSPTSFSDIVTSYINCYREPAAAEWDFYASLPTRAMAVDWAGMACRPDGLRHDHQRRIRRLVLEEVVRRLRAANLSSRTFDGLHITISTAIGGIRGVGELLVYDTSLRIGARLGLQPELVYLHAGTRIGARALGLPTESGSLAPSRLPRAFHRLSPREIEDCLCIYKGEIAAVNPRVMAPSRAGSVGSNRKSVDVPANATTNVHPRVRF